MLSATINSIQYVVAYRETLLSYGEEVCFIVSTCAVTGVPRVRVCRDKRALSEIRQALGERASVVCLSQSLGHNSYTSVHLQLSSIRWLAGVGWGTQC